MSVFLFTWLSASRKETPLQRPLLADRMWRSQLCTILRKVPLVSWLQVHLQWRLQSSTCWWRRGVLLSCLLPSTAQQHGGRRQTVAALGCMSYAETESSRKKNLFQMMLMMLRTVSSIKTLVPSFYLIGELDQNWKTNTLTDGSIQHKLTNIMQISQNTLKGRESVTSCAPARTGPWRRVQETRTNIWGDTKRDGWIQLRAETPFETKRWSDSSAGG